MSHTTTFADRHIGPRDSDIQEMLDSLELTSLDELIDRTVPSQIRTGRPLDSAVIGDGESEQEVLAELRDLAGRNRVYRSYIGMGYADCITPPVILRNLLEDPRWYTPYTPYQSEVSQGRLEALLNFQTMVADLTAMEISNASLLDEATAAAEAMAMAHAIHSSADTFFVSAKCHPTTIAVIQSRAAPLGIHIEVGNYADIPFDRPLCGAIFQYPDTDGVIEDLAPLSQCLHASGALMVVAADLLSLALIKPPGEMGADIVVGNSQRFGVPMGYGGPHAAFMATKDEYKRHLPGRIVGVSRDAAGQQAVRLALQTREQHIRRERATSNICTAQVLLANIAGMYAVYHGPGGLRRISEQVHSRATSLHSALKSAGIAISDGTFFDTIVARVGEGSLHEILGRASERRINLRVLDNRRIGVTLDETTTEPDVADLVDVITGRTPTGRPVKAEVIPSRLQRTSTYLSHPVFNSYHSETELLRYMNRLANKDLSLASSMIPLGSCTMKLNATAEMISVTWPEFAKLHPFAPLDQAEGYQELFRRLEAMLAEITGFDAISLQPNAGSQGEYAGMLVIRRYHEERGEMHRDVCLIPQSAHGTNPATAAMAGMKIEVVRTDEHGNIDVQHLRSSAQDNAGRLAALMVTYPSTHGVFEEAIGKICDIVHRCGGQVFMDGANMNAQVGITRPGDFGPDVCHLNLHKTFCIPHGGGGPGMGPIGVKAHLAPYLPSHPIVHVGGDMPIGPVSEAPWGSASILPISYAYLRLMGVAGLKKATQVAILNANYVARRLDPHFPVLYKGAKGFIAHECIVDCRPLKATSGIEVEDVAKRLMDYGFHAPTVSFPVPGTMMIEPTESETMEELDRFCDAMIAIRQEVAAIQQGRMDRIDNPLKNAPHTAEAVSQNTWAHPYSREQAAYPAPWTRESKYWPPVARVDNVYGDRNIVCSCPPIEEYD